MNAENSKINSLKIESKMQINSLKIEKIIDGENAVFYPVLIQQESRNYLVDCGYEETYEEIKSELALIGIYIPDLTGVIITHDDHDHLGCLYQLKQNNKNLNIFCGEHEKQAVSGETKSERLNQAELLFDEMPQEFKNWAENFIKKLKNIKRVEVDKVFKDNELFEEEIIIVNTPGHSKGHISLFLPKTKILIAGDAIVVQNGEFDIANTSYTLDMKNTIKSVEKIRSLKPLKVICYHGGVLDEDIYKKLSDLIRKYQVTF